MGPPVGATVGLTVGEGVGLPGKYVGDNVGSAEGAADGADVGKYVGAPTKVMLLVDTITEEALVIAPDDVNKLATADVTAVVNDESEMTVLEVLAVMPYSVI